MRDPIAPNLKHPSSGSASIFTDPPATSNKSLDQVPVSVSSSTSRADSAITAESGIAGRGGRPRGTPKTGGRRRGTPNKATFDVAAKLARLRCDPIEGLARIAMNPKTPVETRVRCYSELLPYLYPKRKSVDDSSQAPRECNYRTIHETVPWELKEAHDNNQEIQKTTQSRDSF